MTIQYKWLLIGIVIGILLALAEKWIRKTIKKRKVVVFKTPGSTETMKADAVGFCKREPGHDGPCNGFPVVTCPGYQNWKGTPPQRYMPPTAPLEEVRAEIGVCNKHPSHQGICNGNPRLTCPSYSTWLKLQGGND